MRTLTWFTSCSVAAILFWGWILPPAHCQVSERDRLLKALETQLCVLTSDNKVRICRGDYHYRGHTVEALVFQPNRAGKFPGLFMIPGYEGTPNIYFNIAVIFARFGFASMAVGTPAFGRTDLKPDFLGRHTIAAYIKGYHNLEQEPFVDQAKTGIFGYSRGAIAASLMLTKLNDTKAAVVGGGIYDLEKAFQDLTIEGIKDDIRKEAGTSAKAFRKRSAVYMTQKITSPILILHGEGDLNAPTNQAYLFRDALRQARKDVDLQILAGHKHGVLDSAFISIVFNYFNRRLNGATTDLKFR
jgi:dipeptidyl aminopeptidase/acylaminoacyl peptidase